MGLDGCEVRLCEPCVPCVSCMCPVSPVSFYLYRLPPWAPIQCSVSRVCHGSPVSYLMCARVSRVCVPCVNVNTTNATTSDTACVSRVRPGSPRCLFTGTGAAASVVALTSGNMCVVGGFGWL